MTAEGGTNSGNTVRKHGIVLTALCVVALVSGIAGQEAQSSFGQVDVRNIWSQNRWGTGIRVKLLSHIGVAATSPAPGIVYVHGYQNNREMSDPFVIELARCRMVVSSIDAIGRSNSEFPGPWGNAAFDRTFGAAAALAYLRGLDMLVSWMFVSSQVVAPIPL